MTLKTPLSIHAAVLFTTLVGVAFAQSASTNSLLISPGDELHVSILDMPDLEQYPRVTDTGEVPVQGVGSVRVANMTPAEAASAIHDRLVTAKFLNHPQVTVVVDQYATQEVTLIGEVRTPGAYPIATPRPILDVIALGGGLNETADRSVLVERNGDQNNLVHYTVSNDAQQAIEKQVLVNPGDTIVVPKAGIVYVLGDVNRPGGYTMSDNESTISLLEVLSIAGGPAKTAKLNQTRLIRKAGHSETQIAVGDIQKGKRPDFAMMPGDILYVPFSYSKNLFITSSAGLVGAAGAAAIYTSH
jgi:polysaccharide export outer membrane protein